MLPRLSNTGWIRRGWEFTFRLLLLMILLIVIFRVGLLNRELYEWANGRTKVKPPAARPAQQQVIVPTQSPWTTRTLQIPPEGVSVFLSCGWNGITKGGPIFITTPRGQTFQDRPGVTTNLGVQPDGVYSFQADPPGSKRSIEIYNRW